MPNIDVIIIGSGISALTAAYKLSVDKNVIIITKLGVTNSNSILAQGGVASSIGKDDTWYSHYLDTISAGCEHNREAAVELLVKTGPEYLLRLIKDGMQFDLDKDKNLVLGKEGAHSTRRILHAGGDATGRALVLHMLEKVKNNVHIIENETAIDLVIENYCCSGVITKTIDGSVKKYYSNHIILATGGCGALFSFTSNDTSITGDGLAMAYRAGAELTDLEFIQFHPTLLNKNGIACGLVSEAVRGEGAILVDEDGRRIMKGKHPLLDLAPRDIVARELFNEMCKGKQIYLDISMIDEFQSHFPTITELCKVNEIDIKNGLIPVIPGAHFSMGGVRTDERGRTSLTGLYAVGEVACTGVHGANRLASNSLLEGIVFGNLVATDIIENQLINSTFTDISTESLNIKNIRTITLPTKEQIRKVMMENVGIVRNQERLEFAISWFESYKHNFEGYSLSTFTSEQIQIMNMITVGWLIATSALKRTESRGGHFREDFSSQNDRDWLKKEVIRSLATEKVLSSL